MTFLLKINRLGPKAVILALALGDDRTATFDVTVKDYVSSSALPVTPGDSDDGEGEGRELKDVFISGARVEDLRSLLRINVIQKLAPGLQKEGYEAQSQDRAERVAQEGDRARDPAATRDTDDGRRDPLRDYNAPRPAIPHPFDDPLAAGPRRGGPIPDFAPPGFEDEYEIGRPRGLGGQGGGAARRPLNIGERDLYPAGLGPNDPLRPGLGGFGGGGGMHPTFDDPMFGGVGGGSGGYDPHAPPGARYDPIGPGGQPRDFGGRGGFPGGGSGGRGGFGGGGNPFGGYGPGDFL